MNLIKEFENVYLYCITATPKKIFYKFNSINVFPIENTTSEEYHGWSDNQLKIIETITLESSELVRELNHYLQNLEINEDLKKDVEFKIQATFNFCRKYRVKPEDLENLSDEWQSRYELLTKLLDETYAKEKGGVFKTLHSSVKTEQARKEQAEVASWGFMEAFGINVALSDININLIWGDKTKIKDELQPKQQRFAIQSIDKSVKYLVGYVNTEMKKANNISETEGQAVIGKAPSIMDYAKKLGMQDIFNESNVIQELHERIVRKLMKRI